MGSQTVGHTKNSNREMQKLSNFAIFFKEQISQIMAGPRIRVAVPRKLHNTGRSKEQETIKQQLYNIHMWTFKKLITL